MKDLVAVAAASTAPKYYVEDGFIICRIPQTN